MHPIPIKNYTNYFMGFLLLFAFIGLAISSAVLWFVLPRGQGLHGDPVFCSWNGWGYLGNLYQVFGLPRYIWVEVHSWIAAGFAALILVHLLLHWRWLLEATRRLKILISRRLKAILERYTTAALLFVLFAFQIFSGCTIWLILPRGRQDYYNMIGDTGRTFLGLQRNEWLDAHAWVAAAIAGLILVHIVIHWR